MPHDMPMIDINNIKKSDFYIKHFYINTKNIFSIKAGWEHTKIYFLESYYYYTLKKAKNKKFDYIYNYL